MRQECENTESLYVRMCVNGRVLRNSPGNVSQVIWYRCESQLSRAAIVLQEFILLQREADQPFPRILRL